MNGTMTRNQTLRLTMTGMFMAMTVILSLSIFSIPVPGGHLYFCDTVINVAAILLDPVSAFVVGGIGSFLGDFFFYPAPMFVSLVTHGLQAVVVSLISHRILKRRQALASGIGVIVGAIIMVIGYTLGRAYVYSTPEYSLLKLPFEIVQAGFGAVFAMIVCYPLRLREMYLKVVH
ncbi:MAG: ECF transporter S component [Clostridia bacterium]|nr:ECF transporter S component [Clostridia bacterium]MBQ6120497.1 ECF transporter S component [Clostridia bacterium]